MRRVMMAAAALMLLLALSGESAARVYAIGRVTPDVVLDGEPEFPNVANHGIDATSVEDSGSRQVVGVVSRSGTVGCDATGAHRWWAAIWRLLWALR